MLTPKKIAIPAAVGFVISFVISLFFAHSFFWSLIRGVIFAVIFALVFLLIEFLFNTFLEQGSDVEVSAEKKPSATGNRVDITISDEELSDDGGSLRFSVDSNKKGIDSQSFKDVDSKVRAELDDVGAAMQNASEQNDDGFLQGAKESHATEASAETVAVSANAAPAEASAPVASAVKQDEAKPAFVPSSVADVAASSSSASSSDSVAGIDNLPDLSGFDALTGEAGDSSDVIDDTEFASSGVSSPASRGSTFSDGTKGADHDAETMAKAIATILKRDE